MTRKDYVAIAAAIKSQRGADLTPAHAFAVTMRLDALADDLAVYFAADNPRFDRAKFLTACGAA